MITDIDIQRTISTNKVVFRLNLFDQGLNILLKGFLVLITPLLLIFYSLENLNNFSDDVFGLVMTYVVTFGFAIIVYLFVKDPTRLIRFPGKGLKLNRLIAKDALENMGWTIALNTNQCIIGVPENTYERQLTVLFDGNDLLVSSIRFGKSNVMMTYNQDNLDLFNEQFKQYWSKG